MCRIGSRRFARRSGSLQRGTIFSPEIQFPVEIQRHRTVSVGTARRQIGRQVVVVAQFLYRGGGIHADLRLQNRTDLFGDGDGLFEACFGDRHGWRLNQRFFDQLVQLGIVIGRPPFLVRPVPFGSCKGLAGLVLFDRFHFR